MSKEELINAICDINKKLEENQKAFEPFVGRRLDSISTDELMVLRRLRAELQQLVDKRAELRSIATYELGIFVM